MKRVVTCIFAALTLQACEDEVVPTPHSCHWQRKINEAVTTYEEAEDVTKAQNALMALTTYMYFYNMAREYEEGSRVYADCSGQARYELH